MSDRIEAIKRGVAEGAKRGRRAGPPFKVTDAQIQAAIPLGTAAGAHKVGLSKTQFITRRKRLEACQDG